MLDLLVDALACVTPCTEVMYCATQRQPSAAQRTVQRASPPRSPWPPSGSSLASLGQLPGDPPAPPLPAHSSPAHPKGPLPPTHPRHPSRVQQQVLPPLDRQHRALERGAASLDLGRGGEGAQG